MRRKLTFIDISYFRGGAEISLEYLINALKHYNIKLIITHNNFLNLKNVEIQYLQIKDKYIMANKKSIMSIIFVLKAIKQSLCMKEDTIITNTFKSHILGFFIMLFNRANYWILLERDVPENILIMFIKRILYKYADTVVFNSVFLRNIYKFNIHNALTIYNIIEKIDIDRENVDYPVFLFIGRLNYEKGFDRVLDVFKIIRNKINNSKLFVFGEGELKEEYKGIEYFGFINDLNTLYKNGDFILMFNRVKESFSRAIFEAMLYGIIPVILSDNGMDDYTRNNHNALIFNSYDKHIIAAKIIDIINNKKKMQKLKQMAKSNVYVYNKDKVLKQWNNIFKRAYNKPS